jgi:hypothetical protein
MDLQKSLSDKNHEIQKIFDLIERLEPALNLNNE